MKQNFYKTINKNHTETIKTNAAMWCEWLELMDGGWITK